MTHLVRAELSPKWPALYWDDWLRGPDVRKVSHGLQLQSLLRTSTAATR